MIYLGHPQSELEAARGSWTAQEISQQPLAWSRITDVVIRESGTLRAFLGPLLERPDLRIVLTGAGTSAFVGECLAPPLKRATRRRVEAIATTDLVGSPDSWLEPAAPTLLVSFGRSGNSPESLAALTLVQQHVTDCYHLIVTCNSEGELHRRGQQLSNAHVLLLPEETNDRGFAMTSSFTGMMLAVALAFDALPRESPEALSRWASYVLEAELTLVTSLARAGFERVVYLGNQEFKGLAREAALKMLELSDGKVVALAETPLGFRHGPKTIVNGKTLIVMFLSNEPHGRQYELDLLRELRADGIAARVVALSGAPSDGESIAIPAAAGASNLALCFPYAVFAQMLAFLQSLTLGLKPDTPNARGVVSRVVQGVSIYPWNPSR
jgi:tagatose-6-phosphate ketose/aldose isomerase